MILIFIFICLSQDSSPDDVTKYNLTEAQVDQYWNDGYLSGIRVLSDEQCDLLLEDYKIFLVGSTPLYMYVITYADMFNRMRRSFILVMDCSMSSIVIRVETLTMSFYMH